MARSKHLEPRYYFSYGYKLSYLSKPSQFKNIEKVFDKLCHSYYSAQAIQMGLEEFFTDCRFQVERLPPVKFD